MGHFDKNAKWHDKIYQIERTDPVVGGEGGISNQAPMELADRTEWLKQQIELQQCNSIEELRTIEPTQDKQMIYVKGYYTNSIKGGGYFVADFADTATADNGGTVIVTNGGKRWLRVYSEVSVFDFGAMGDGIARRLNADFNDLLQAQKRYPTARALTDTYDLLGIEAALIFSREVRLPKGQYFINRSIPVPSDTALVGDGWTSQINCTDDMPRYAHMIVNAQGDYIVGGKTDEQVVELINGNQGNKNITIKNLYLRGDLDSKLQMTRSGVCLKHVSGAVIERVKTAWTGFHGIDIADASEGHISDMANLAGTWETKPSDNILVADCFVEYHGDDGYTTHYSTDITFKHCYARYGAQSFSAENGFEVDDGSRNVVLDNCIAVREQCGFVVKRHDGAKPSSSAQLNNCIAQFCGYGFWLYGAQTIKKGQYSEAYGVELNNCISIFTRKQERINQRAIRDLLIQDFTGVSINNFTAIGWHLDGQIKCVDLSDYQPLYTTAGGILAKVTDEMLPYAGRVINNGIDETTKTTVNVLIGENCRNIAINNMQLLGCQATQAHIYMLSSAEGVRGISLQNVQAVDCSGANVIGVPSDCPTDLRVSGVYAESKFDVSQYAIFVGSAATNLIKRTDLDSVSGQNYGHIYKFGTMMLSAKSYRQHLSVMGAASNTQAVSELISTSHTALWQEYRNFSDSLMRVTSTNNSMRHLVKDGLALWLGHFDSDGTQQPKCGLHSNGNFIPYSNKAHSLGQPTNLWEAVYVDTPAENDKSKKVANTEWVKNLTSSHLANNGWTKQADGSILQWGRYDAKHGTTFNYPIAFNSTPFVVQCADRNHDGSQVHNITVTGETNTQFSIIANNAIGAFTMIAIGR
ncbi:right-handed parallel beta-helix repeat-containing protein [Avibacterium sp. 20-126]|uniref:right-handed parallel beta-helix repeat-containing protein n=1 Tax=Avibacterium sp. 20-126 TaxID=2911524 RepID=UPI0021868629|nr:right-handed parallel beta-helix repeat-containing protein [Avibacterium sp. 20-126]